MPTLKSHEVWIESDGQRYEEYDTKVEGSVVTCYISSQAGKTFQIEWRNHNEKLYVSTQLSYNLDGILLDTDAQNYELGSREAVSKGYQFDRTSFRAYTFSDVKLSDDGGGLYSVSNDFGTICVDVHRVVMDYLPEDYEYIPQALPDEMGMPLNELAKKNGAHRVDLKETLERNSVRVKFCRTSPYEGQINPFVTFRFIYRPKEILQALDIIPVARSERIKRERSSSPAMEPLNRRQKTRIQSSEVKSEDEVDDLLDDDQLERELLAQRDEIDSQLRQLRERRANNAAKVKREVDS